VAEDLTGAFPGVADDLASPEGQDGPSVSGEGVAFGLVSGLAFGGVVVLPAIAEYGDLLAGPGEVDDGDRAGVAVRGTAIAPRVLGVTARSVSIDKRDGKPTFNG
jgi:hypothetical protein